MKTCAAAVDAHPGTLEAKLLYESKRLISGAMKILHEVLEAELFCLECSPI
jgi:hypothetical protein